MYMLRHSTALCHDSPAHVCTVRSARADWRDGRRWAGLRRRAEDGGGRSDGADWGRAWLPAPRASRPASCRAASSHITYYNLCESPQQPHAAFINVLHNQCRLHIPKFRYTFKHHYRYCILSNKNFISSFLLLSIAMYPTTSYH